MRCEPGRRHVDAICAVWSVLLQEAVICQDNSVVTEMSDVWQGWCIAMSYIGVHDKGSAGPGDPSDDDAKS